MVPNKYQLNEIIDLLDAIRNKIMQLSKIDERHRPVIDEILQINNNDGIYISNVEQKIFRFVSLDGPMSEDPNVILGNGFMKTKSEFINEMFSKIKVCDYDEVLTQLHQIVLKVS